MATPGTLEIRCPRNSKNNDGSNCYCNNYIHPLYHGIASKSVICCYADGECCYQKTCRYSHIKANSLMMPCIFELNGRRCNNPKKCIFALSFHKNRCVPRKSEQVYRYDIKHNQTKSRFPRSKRVIDSEFDNNPLLLSNININNNINSSNIPLKTVYVPVPAPTDNHINHKRVVGNNGNRFTKDGQKGDGGCNGCNLCNGHAPHTAHHGWHAEMTAKAPNMVRSGVNVLKNNNTKNNITRNNIIEDNKCDEKEMDIDELDDAILGIHKFESEIEYEIKEEVKRTKEQYKEKGLSMPFSEKIRIKQRIREKYNNMKKQMNDNKKYIKNVTKEKSNEKINNNINKDLINDFAKIEMNINNKNDKNIGIENTTEPWESVSMRSEIGFSCDDDEKDSYDIFYDFGNIDTDC